MTTLQRCVSYPVPSLLQGMPVLPSRSPVGLALPSLHILATDPQYILELEQRSIEHVPSDVGSLSTPTFTRNIWNSSLTSHDASIMEVRVP